MGKTLCPGCGKPNMERVNHCVYCGTKLETKSKGATKELLDHDTFSNSL